jgi:hypothetical protein
MELRKIGFIKRPKCKEEVDTVEMDELYTFIEKKKTGSTS